MPIKFIKGDILTSSYEIICHGVNASGGFGSGIAGQIAKKYPLVRQEYFRKYQDSGWKLGECQFVWIPSINKYIVNICTQEKYGKENKLYVNYEAIENGIRFVLKYALQEKFSVATVKLGCGLGGGDWNIVRQIIFELSREFKDVLIEVYYL